MYAHRFDAYDRFDRETAAQMRREELSGRRDAARRLRGDARALLAGRPDVDAPPTAGETGLMGALRSFGRAWLDCGAALH
ncbi:hypothetical protein [Albimonas pacifica]|uniref:Uncharacterized protein n=1 Tax=Albimonas pacifica TaxID=1114924 RepID=A0A1I3HXP8_9RHOB|nr:hypothetical protein [Albimonas pacifica]SFI40515.1 hypothetical protein SAMN05216258_106230 [Albimonas pacifica]